MIKIKLSEVLKDRNITAYRLQQMTGIRPNTLTEWQRDDGAEIKLISKDVLNRICRALNCKVEDIIEYVPDEEEKKE